MKVKELIAALQKQDPDRDVLVDGYEMGYDLLAEVQVVRAVPVSKPKSWEGNYRDPPRGVVGDACVYLPRTSA